MVRTDFVYGNHPVTMFGYADNDWIFRTISTYQTFYEIDLLRYMRFALRNRPGCIADVGANIGNHSVFYGVVMKRPVLCFEPNPGVFDILKSNLDINKVRHTAFKLGLGDEPGSFVVDDQHLAADGNVGAARLLASDDGDIEVSSLDHLLPEIEQGLGDQPLAAIKVDIEGMEPAMLRGARRALQQFHPDLFLEISDARAMQQINDILLPLEYRRLYAFAGTPVWHYVHQSKLGNLRRLELYLYKTLASLISRAAGIARSLFQRT